MNELHFFNEEINYRLRNIKKLRNWILYTIKNERGELEAINFIFTSDSYLHKINVDYLQHDTYTDIITFEYNEEDSAIISDIYISIDRCKENAKRYKTSFTNEIHRIIIHGVLHLLGYKDKNKIDKELMTTKEDYYLSLRQEFNL
ncbi:MAG: rRNA maturation RNase YbeY [Bacteroidales bacterium]|nr:rRNA maturation RNase YbeY [Bacteroidales bacterium]